MNLISGKFELTMQKSNRYKKKYMNSKNVYNLEDKLEKKVNRVEEQFGILKEKVQEVYEYQSNPDQWRVKLVQREDRLRICNLKMDGIPERPIETWEQCKEEVTDMKLNIVGIEEEVKI